MAVGAALNLIAGSLTLARYSHKNEYMRWMFVTSYQQSKTKNLELGLGIVAVLAGATMLGDLIIGLVL